jgi:hypothetical protein
VLDGVLILINLFIQFDSSSHEGVLWNVFSYRLPGKFWSVVLEKDGEDQLDRSCEK